MKPSENKTDQSSFWCWLGILSTFHLAARLFLKVRIDVQASHLPRPCIVAGKHSSYWDVPIQSHVTRTLFGVYAHWEMASFHGYRFLGSLQWMLRKMGGFSVMRPKDVMRLKRPDRTKDDLRAIMQSVNERARIIRDIILKNEGVLCYFPEGTRTADKIRAFRSRHEIEEGLQQTAEGIPVHLVPVTVSYGTAPRFRLPFLWRRRVHVRVLEPILLEDTPPGEVLDRLRDVFESHWDPSADQVAP